MRNPCVLWVKHPLLASLTEEHITCIAEYFESYDRSGGGKLLGRPMLKDDDLRLEYCNEHDVLEVMKREHIMSDILATADIDSLPLDTDRLVLRRDGVGNSDSEGAEECSSGEGLQHQVRDGDRLNPGGYGNREHRPRGMRRGRGGEGWRGHGPHCMHRGRGGDGWRGHGPYGMHRGRGEGWRGHGPHGMHRGRGGDGWRGHGPYGMHRGRGEGWRGHGPHGMCRGGAGEGWRGHRPRGMHRGRGRNQLADMPQIDVEILENLDTNSTLQAREPEVVHSQDRDIGESMPTEGREYLGIEVENSCTRKPELVNPMTKNAGGGFLTGKQDFVYSVCGLLNVGAPLLGDWLKTVSGQRPASCQFFKDGCKAIVTFEQEIDVHRINRSCHSSEFQLHGQFPKLSKLRSSNEILVSCSPKAPEIDVMELYFQSEQCGLAFNGLFIRIRPRDDGQFIITYKNNRAVKEVLARGSTKKFSGVTFNVYEFYDIFGPCDPNIHHVYKKIEYEDSDVDMKTRLIVHDVVEKDQEIFQLLMRSTKQSGGDKSARISISSNMATVSYDTAEVTERVYKQSQLTGISMLGKKLKVKLESRIPTDLHNSKALRLSGLPTDVDPDRLKFYLSAISDNIVAEILFQKKGSRAIAYFKETIDFAKIYWISQKVMKLDCCPELEVGLEKQITSLVFGPGKRTPTRQHVELMIEDILGDDYEFGVALLNENDLSTLKVTTSPEGVEKLMDDTDTFKGIKITRYSDYLGTDIHCGLVRRCIALSELFDDEDLVNYLLGSGNKWLIDELNTYNCWLESDSIVSECSPADFRTTNAVWVRMKTNLCSKVEKGFSCLRLDNIMPETMREVSHIRNASHLKVKHFNDGRVFAVGEKPVVEELKTKVLQAQRRIKESNRYKTEQIYLDTYKITYLERANHLERLKGKYKLKTLGLDSNSCLLVVHGFKEDVDKCLVELADIFLNLRGRAMHAPSIYLMEICNDELCYRAVENEFLSKGITAVYSTSDSKITAYAATDAEAKEALDCIRRTVWEITFPDSRELDDGEQAAMRSCVSDWEKVKSEIAHLFQPIKIHEQNNRLVVVGVGKNQDRVLRMLQNFFDDFGIIKKKFQDEENVIMYMKRFMGKELKALESKYSCTMSVGDCCINIQGNQKKVSDMEKEVTSLGKSVVKTIHTTDNYHLDAFEKIDEMLKDVGSTFKSLIINETVLKEKTVESSNTRVGGAIRRFSALQASVPVDVKSSNHLVLYGRVNIYVKLGCIEKAYQKVVVNSTGEDLKLSGPLARSILKEAGPQLQYECNQIKPLHVGEVKVTDSYNMSCSKIIHCCLGKFDPSSSEQILRKILRECLQMVESLGCQSVAIPALGTGNLNYPAEFTARHIIEAASEHVGSNPHSVLDEICVWLFPSDTRSQQGFTSVLDDFAKKYTSSSRIRSKVSSPGSTRLSYSRQTISTSPAKKFLSIKLKIYGRAYDSVDSSIKEITNRLNKNAGKQILYGAQSLFSQDSMASDKNGFLSKWDLTAGDDVVVSLKQDSPEYTEVERNFNATFGYRADILEIQRVQYYALYAQYCIQRKSVAKKLGWTEDRVEKTPLWHGTSPESISKIASSFFNRSYAGKNGVAYGRGNYFARSSRYSRKYASEDANGIRCMFQARVIVGECTRGDSKLIDAPFKPGSQSERYDSVVDDIENPSIYVVFPDTSAYPEYIVKFRTYGFLIS